MISWTKGFESESEFVRKFLSQVFNVIMSFDLINTKKEQVH